MAVKVAYSPVYAHTLPEGHRFPMAKYELLGERILHEGIITQEQLIMPGNIPEEVVLRTHTKDYFMRLTHLKLSPSEQRKIGFPLDEALLQRELKITMGTYLCCLHALTHKSCALNVAGGTHHAFADRGEGFCMLNDFAVAINQLLYEKKVSRVLIADLDVHQGNGTAALFDGRAEVFTFSMHGEKNYPFHKEKSDLDIALADGTDTDTYLTLLKNHLPELVKKVRPDLICYLAGADILEGDRYGKLNVSMEGCMLRDEFVFDTCVQHGIPVAVSMGGGYSPDISRITEAHFRTFVAAAARWY